MNNLSEKEIKRIKEKREYIEGLKRDAAKGDVEAECLLENTHPRVFEEIEMLEKMEKEQEERREPHIYLPKNRNNRYNEDKIINFQEEKIEREKTYENDDYEEYDYEEYDYEDENNAKRKPNPFKRGLAIAAGAAGVAALGFVATTGIPRGEDLQKPTQEPKIETTESPEPTNTIEEEVKKEIETLQEKEDVVEFLKNIYIEKYEEMTGDETLTTDDIKIRYNKQNHIYFDKQTGEYFTHGGEEYAQEVIERLGMEGNVGPEEYKRYDTVEDEYLYKILKDGEIIDAIAYIDGSCTEVINGAIYYGNIKQEDSVLETLENIIKKGLHFYEHVEGAEHDRKNTADAFKNALIEAINNGVITLEDITGKEEVVVLENDEIIVTTEYTGDER